MELADGRVFLHAGDCLEVLVSMPERSVDAVVTDPPYELGFMGKSWDASGVAFSHETWRLVWRVMKPGAHLVAFGAPKNYHRLACAIEDAGFEIRDSLMWVTGQGFPKSHNIGCKCDGDAIPYTHERAEQTPECDLRRMRDTDVSQAKFTEKEREEVLLNGLQEQGLYSPKREPSSETSVWREEPGLEGRSNISASARELCDGEIRQVSKASIGDGQSGRVCDGASFSDGDEDRANFDKNGMRSSSGSQSAEQSYIKSGVVAGQSQSQANGTREACPRCGQPLGYKGYGTALKPAYEPIVLARKPLSEGTVAANVLRWGTGALNIDATRIATDENRARNNKARASGTSYIVQREDKFIDPGGDGRWPANLCHDGSQQVLDLFPHTKSGNLHQSSVKAADKIYGGGFGNGKTNPRFFAGNEGSAARFFYCAKASKQDRAGSKHPTVKPINLMRWLVRMVTPPGGTVLDPFAGSGTTAQAAVNEGFQAVLIEREEEYQSDIRNRLSA